MAPPAGATFEALQGVSEITLIGRRVRSNSWQVLRSPTTTRRSTARSLDHCGPAGGYSTKVQQPARIPEDWCAHPETLTCTYILLWMPCLLFASRGPGVRVPLAPQFRDIIRNREPRYGGGYSSKVQQR